MSSPNEIECLRNGADWVGRLAKRLIANPADAEDLAQDAWVVLLEGDAGKLRRPEAWFQGVLRNLRSKQHRSSVRRSLREERAARKEALPAAVEATEEIELQSEVARAVLDLPEPIRNVLLLRFHRELSVRATAAELQLAPSTVHSRVQRGLELLRERLDQSHGGDRKAWVLALLPLADKSPGITTSITLSLLMSTNLKLAALLILLFGGAWGLWSTGDQESLAEVQSAQKQEVTTQAPTESLSQPKAAEATRRVAEAPQNGTEEIEQEELAAATSMHVDGRLVDLAGNPLASLTLVYVPSGSSDSHEGLAQITTSADGSFQTDLPDVTSPETATGAFHIQEKGFVTVIPGRVGNVYGSPDAKSCTVVASKSHTFRGRVTNGAFELLAGVELVLTIDSHVFRRASSEASAPLRSKSWSTTTAADGSFEFDGVPGGAGISLKVSTDGYPTKQVPLPNRDELAMDIVLSAPSGGEKMWGLVVAPDGTPVAGALVSTGTQSVRTNESGHFELNRERGRWGAIMDANWGGEVLRAVKPGFLPAEAQDVQDLAPPVRLVLGGEPLRIRGQVVNREGKPVGGALVWSIDLTRFGFSPRESTPSGFASEQAVEGILGGGLSVVADANGHFELSGLLDKKYTLSCLVPGSLATGDEQVVQAGTERVRLEVDDEKFLVSGHLTGFDGSPLANIPVQAMRPPQPGGNAWSGLRSPIEPPRSITDENGYFELGPMAIKGNTLSVLGRGIQAFHASILEEEPDLQRIKIQVAARVKLQINLERDPTFASDFQILDRDERVIAIHVVFPGGMTEMMQSEITNGLSQVLQTTQRAHWLVLRKRGVEVQRLRLDLAVDELNVIRP